MTALEAFNNCTSGGYKNTDNYLSWKIENDIMYFQCSRQKEDWLRNFDIIFRKTILNWSPIILTEGFDEAFEEVLSLLKLFDVDGFVGYSHGAVIASLCSAVTDKPAIVFGCPNYMLFPSAMTKRQFSKVTSYENVEDIVTKIPPVYTRCGTIIKMKTPVIKPVDVSLVEWLSGHSPKMYRQRLEVL